MVREHGVPRPGAAFQWGALGAGALGLLLCLVGVLVDPARTLFSYLAAFAFGISIALGALLWTALAQATGAAWFLVFRRLAGAMAATLPLFALLFLPLLFGLEVLYPWSRPATLFSPEVQLWMARTAGYLNVPFFLARAAVYFLVWIAAAEGLRRGRVRRPATAAVAAIAVVFTASFAAVDWLMSLVPLWPSAVWGLYYFAGGLVGALGLLAVLGYTLRRDGSLDGVLAVSHTHALGKLLLVALLFWAYVAYSQYLIVWIADIPREVVWYHPRTWTSWRWVGAVLVVGHLLLPAAALLSWRVKRHAAALAAVGAWVVAMHYVDLYWIVLPALHPEGFVPHWLDLAALLGVGGVVTGFGAWRLRSRRVVPTDDPRLAAALEYTTR